jgi:hypothetical protein
MNGLFADHDWRKCGCGGCTERRGRAWNKQRAPLFEEPTLVASSKAHFISTAQLEIDMVVVLNNQSYRVKKIEMDVHGYYLEIVNLKSRMQFVMMVSFARGNQKYWEPAAHWRR